VIPSNDFNQETGTNAEIKDLINSAGGASFTILSKSAVNGPKQHPLIDLLKVSICNLCIRLGTTIG
jgi:glutathione peroxidase-family protein